MVSNTCGAGDNLQEAVAGCYIKKFLSIRIMFMFYYVLIRSTLLLYT